MWLEMEKERKREMDKEKLPFFQEKWKSLRKAPANAGYLGTRRDSLSGGFASPEMQRQFFPHP